MVDKISAKFASLRANSSMSILLVRMKVGVLVCIKVGTRTIRHCTYAGYIFRPAAIVIASSATAPSLLSSATSFVFLHYCTRFSAVVGRSVPAFHSTAKNMCTKLQKGPLKLYFVYFVGKAQRLIRDNSRSLLRPGGARKQGAGAGRCLGCLLCGRSIRSPGIFFATRDPVLCLARGIRSVNPTLPVGTP